MLRNVAVHFAMIWARPAVIYRVIHQVRARIKIGLLLFIAARAVRGLNVGAKDVVETPF